MGASEDGFGGAELEAGLEVGPAGEKRFGFEAEGFPWSEWEERAYEYAERRLHHRQWLIEREGRARDLKYWTGLEGYRRAVDTFDPARGEFEPWLRFKIKQVVADMADDCDYPRWRDSTELTDDMGLQQSTEPAPELAAERHELRDHLKAFVEHYLRPREELLFWTVLANHSPNHITDAAVSLDWTREDAQRTWERIKYKFRRYWPRAD